jgi:hypothetical protein
VCKIHEPDSKDSGFLFLDFVAEIGVMHQTFNLGFDKMYVGSIPTGVTNIRDC